MPKGIVASPVLCHLLIIVNMETEACWTTVGSTISQYRRGRRFRRLHGKDAFSEVRNIRISIRRSIGWLTSIVWARQRLRPRGSCGIPPICRSWRERPVKNGWEYYIFIALRRGRGYNRSVCSAGQLLPAGRFLAAEWSLLWNYLSCSLKMKLYYASLFCWQYCLHLW